MGTPKPSIGPVLVAVAFAFACFGLGLFIWSSFGGPVPLEAEQYRFHASFGTEASQIAPGAQARIAGVPVGRVVRTTPDGRTIDIEIEMDPEYAPVPADTEAVVRYKTLLGESFIELSQGSPKGPYLDEGGELPAVQVTEAQQVDAALSVFDPKTRRDFKRFLSDTATVLRGRGQDVGEAIGSSAPTTSELAALLETLDRQRSAIGSLVRDSAVAFDAIGRHEAAVQSLVTAGDSVLSTTAARNRELTETIRALPPFLTALRGTLGEAKGAGREAQPILDRLRPVAPLVRPGLEGTIALAPELQALAGELGETLPTARRALPELRRITDAAHPLVDTLYPAGRELVPFIQYLERYKHEGTASFSNAGSATQGSTEQLSGPPLHYLRATLPVWTEELLGYPQRLPTSRYNPYFAPGVLDELAQGLPSLDCRNTENEQVGPRAEAPPCRVQSPWVFFDKARSFAHVTRLEK